MKATKGFSVSDWCGNFEITFQGELGIDWGGLRREWFELICSSLFDPRGGLFRSFHDKHQALVHPNPSRAANLKLKYFEFAGKIVGKCLYESALGGTYRQLVRARFSRSFLAQLIGLRVHYKYFEQDDPDLFLSKIKYILETDLDQADSMELFFVEEVYDTMGQLHKTVELIPNGARVRVTNATKNQYLDALAQQRLCANVKEEVDSFLKGLNGIIPDNLLSIFDENELEVSLVFFFYILNSNILCLFLYIASSLRHWRVLDHGLPGASHCQRKLERVSTSTRLVLGGRQQFQPNRNGKIVAVHNGMLTIAAWWLPSNYH